MSAKRADEKSSSLERMLSILDLFTERRPIWSVEEMVEDSGYRPSTLYRYLRELSDSGLVTQVHAGKYSLGPRIMQLNSQLHASDPLLLSMQSLRSQLPKLSGAEKWHLCRLLRDEVICIAEYGELSSDLSYTVGRPMPLLRGATSTAVLAWLPDRQLTRIYLANQSEACTPTLGNSWDECKKALKNIRKRKYAHAISEIDPGVFGVAAPLFSPDKKVIGSISNIRQLDELDYDHLDKDGAVIAEFANRLSNKFATYF